MKKTNWSQQTFVGQHEDEEVRFMFRQHPVVMRRTLLASLAIIALSSLPLALRPLDTWPRWFFGAGLLLAALVFVYRYIGWYFSIFIITDERLIQIRQKGFFNRSVSDVSHNRIQSVNYEVKGLQATMFHYGTIIVQTYVGENVLRFIHKPENVHQLLVKTIRLFKPEQPADIGEE